MLNASGKARRGTATGREWIEYHADDRPHAVEGLRVVAPIGSTLVFIDLGAAGCRDVYALVPGATAGAQLRYVSKYVGSILGRKVYDGAKRRGVELGDAAIGLHETVKQLGVVVHGDPNAYNLQEIR